MLQVPSHNGQNTIINNNTLVGCETPDTSQYLQGQILASFIMLNLVVQGNNRARGIYYKGSNGQVTNNRILQPLGVCSHHLEDSMVATCV